MTDKPIPPFFDWFFENEAEYEALIEAEDGNIEKLAAHVEEYGILRTAEARKFVAARLRGEKRKRGLKRTAKQQSKEIMILGDIRELQMDYLCSEHKACEIFLELHPEFNEDTLRTYIRRAKQTLKEMFGREPPPVVPKMKNSEPRR